MLIFDPAKSSISLNESPSIKTWEPPNILTRDIFIF